MNIDRAIHVSRDLFWQSTWRMRCDVCDDDMDYADWPTAVASADAHARRHEREKCVTCGAMPTIRYSEW